MLININQCSWSFFNGIIIIIRSQFFFSKQTLSLCSKSCRVICCISSQSQKRVSKSAQTLNARVDAHAVMECTGSCSYWLIQARALFLLCIVINETFQLQKTFALPVFRRESCWLVTYLEWVLLGVLTNKEDNGKRNRKGLKSSSVCLSLR